MYRDRKLRICLAASAGGHMSQLLKLRECWKGHRTFYVTTADIVREKLQKYGEVFVIGECNREHPLWVITVLFRCIRIIRRERPDVIVSTGAAPGLLMCLSGKFFGSKVAWIDSIANVERLSLSGRMAKTFADLFLTQWPELARPHRNVEYVGAVI